MTKTRLLAAVAFLAGCAETGQDQVLVPLYVAGSDVSQAVTAAFDVPVVIDRAELAFGPLYLCAGSNAGDLCDTARLEWLGTVVVDATNAEPELIGELAGVSGPVRSWMYDLGISSQLTREAPYVLDAAEALGGASLALEGRAIVDGIEIPFEIEVPIQQTDDTELGVPVVRRSTSDEFFHDVGTEESALLVSFEPRTWVRGIDFRSQVGAQTCDESDAGIVCDGLIERTCEAQLERSTRDCSESGEICLRSVGCVERFVIKPNTEPYRAVRNALVSGVRPTFSWDIVP